MLPPLRDQSTHLQERVVGKRQTIETLLNEEVLLLAKFLRDEKMLWNPRIPAIKSQAMQLRKVQRVPAGNLT